MAAPEPPPRLPARLVPDEPFPAYSYVTGRFPHPISDPAGHSYGHVVERPVPIDPTQWRDSRTYCYAIDLFNYGYYWEAHEVWEALWHAAGRRGPVADFLKGLIKLAAAGVKAREGRLPGVHRHAQRAQELFASVQVESGGVAARFLGLDLAELIGMARRLSELPVLPPCTAAPVARVLEIVLLPE